MASLQLRVLGSKPQVKDHLLDKDETFLGRDANCDVVLPALFVARRHARIFRIDGQFFIEDLSTICGTRVNNRDGYNQIRGPTLLRDGDTIVFGSEMVVQFRE
jgi:pSer/pThr/pTyr-binding forkhead associated (FHA) protein